MQQEVARRRFFQPLYEFAHTFLVTTGISNESVKYYASLVQFYTVYKLQRIAVATTRLYLLYVYDLLHNNTTDFKPERHSTDTHGTNQVNFWILHVFGYRFAPRYRDLYKRMDTLVGFMHPNHYKDFLIKPVRKVFDSLICKEWPNVQRIVASLAQKDVTQATIVRKLASYRRQNQTKKALWELDNICRTLYILDFI
jgi:TnpA family transposase